MFEEPQRHRDTEFAQRCFLNSPQPRRHKDTKESQNPPSHPVETADHADRRRWGHATFLCAARSRPSEYRNHHSTSFDETCALEERRSRHSSSSFNRCEGLAPAPKYEREERQNRRAPGTSAGEKRCDDKRSRSEIASFSPATGDRRSPVVLPRRSEITFQAQHLTLCVGGWVVGLRVFVSSWLRRASWADLCDLWAVLSVPSVPLWFFGRRIPRSA